MRIIIPIRESVTNIEFSDYTTFKVDLINIKKDFLLLENLNNIINDEIDEESTELLKKILISNFKFKTKEEIFRNNEYKKHFLKLDKFIWGEFMIIDTTINYLEKTTSEYFNIYYNLSKKLLNKLAIIFNLTYEFSLDFMVGFLFNSNNELLGRTDIHYNHIESAYKNSYKINWPPLNGVKLTETINWIINKDIKLSGISNSKASIALNAFSQVFDNLRQRNTSYLFWCVLGIESLLAEGNSNLTQQIINKCNLILGEPHEFKNKLSKLYNFRSRFIHGDIHIPISHDLDTEKFEDEYLEYLDFSISILLALLRKLIKENKIEFKFEYKLL